MRHRASVLYIVLSVAALALFGMSIVIGSVHIPVSDVLKLLFRGTSDDVIRDTIILDSRLPRTLTAIISGGSLAVSGLMLQTLFRNPLAGPSILGISDGANLGVAVVMLYGGGLFSASGFTAGGYMAVISAAFIGAGVMLAIVVLFSNFVNNSVMLLIIGIMLGYMASSVISILNWTAAADQVNQFVMWGMGDFSSVSMEKLPWLCGVASCGVFLSFLMTKQLNALLLGDSYAVNLGVNIRRTRTLVFISAGLQTAAVTAFCGPVSFIGLAVPHVARLISGTSDHRYLLPFTFVCGCCMALLCNMLTVLPIGGGVLPLNAVTPLIGAPVIVYVILNRRNLHYFN